MSANSYACYYTEYMQCISQFYFSYTQDILEAAFLLGE